MELMHPGRVDQMRLRDLLLLEQIAEHGSLRLVAQALHITQPAVTLALQGLERAFGASLVERGRRGARLTPAGQAVLVRVRAARQEIRQAQRVALQPQAPQLRVGSSHTAMLTLVPDALVRLRACTPHVQVEVVERGAAQLWEQLDQGAFDVIVTRLPNPSQGTGLPPGLVFETVAREQMVIVGAQHNPAIQRALTVTELAAMDWVLPPPDAPAMMVLNEAFAQAGVPTPAPKLVCGSIYAQLGMVAQTQWLSMVPRTAAHRWMGPGPVKVVQSDLHWGPIDMVCAQRATGTVLPAVRSLIDCLRLSTEAHHIV